MPNKVAVNVRNCAITKRTFDAISWSSEIASETNVRTTATAKDAVAMVFSSIRACLVMLQSDFVVKTWEIVTYADIRRRLEANLWNDGQVNVLVQVVLNCRPRLADGGVIVWQVSTWIIYHILQSTNLVISVEIDGR